MFLIPLWVYIGLGAQVLWVIGAIIDKYLIETFFRSEDGEEEGVGALLFFSSIFALGISLAALLFGANSISFETTSIVLGLIIGVSNALWVWMYLYAIEHTELSRAIPIFQTIPIFGFIFGFILLGETLTLNQTVGAFIVIIGAFILSYHFSTKSFNWKSLLLMVGASAIVAFQETLFKFVALDTSFWNSAFWLGLGFSLFGAMLYILIPKYRNQFKKCTKENALVIWSANGFNEIIDSVATLTFAFAVILGPVALVQSVNAYQPLLMLVASYLFLIFIGDHLDEDVSKKTLTQKIIGVGIITIGSVLLYWSLH